MSDEQFLTKIQKEMDYNFKAGFEIGLTSMATSLIRGCHENFSPVDYQKFLRLIDNHKKRLEEVAKVNTVDELLNNPHIIL